MKDLFPQTDTPTRVVAVVEDGCWRVKDLKTGAYWWSNAPWDKHGRLHGDWKGRDALQATGWLNCCWGEDDPDDQHNGRAAQMIATFLDAINR